MTRAEVLAYAQTLEFIPLCLHWGTCQACGVVVWWADWRGAHLPRDFSQHRHDDGVTGNVIHAGHYQFSVLERAGREDPNPPSFPYAPKARPT